MKRVVITGLGIVSCIGNDAETVTNNLKSLNSGISSAPEYEEFSFGSLVHGKPDINLEENIDMVYNAIRQINSTISGLKNIGEEK